MCEAKSDPAEGHTCIFADIHTDDSIYIIVGNVEKQMNSGRLQILRSAMLIPGGFRKRTSAW